MSAVTTKLRLKVTRSYNMYLYLVVYWLGYWTSDFQSPVQFPAITLPGYFSEISDHLWQVNYLRI